MIGLSSHDGGRFQSAPLVAVVRGNKEAVGSWPQVANRASYDFFHERRLEPSYKHQYCEIDPCLTFRKHSGTAGLLSMSQKTVVLDEL